MQIPENLRDRHEYPGMVHWFSPTVLAKVAQKAVASAIFGQYADRRLIRASLDILNDEIVQERVGDGTTLERDKDGAVWIDYVADLGDGFDSTYAIAYLLGQPSITVTDAYELPRGACLIMGGDQVYPDASRYDYAKRMQRPYQFAFPDSNSESAKHPPVYLIPGNHDWYDGLALFLAKFCRGRPTRVGSWRASQHRSYFAVRLPENWWIWGYDSQLMEDIDKPQADYFFSVAKCMPPDAKIILCAAVPSWLKAEVSVRDDSERAQFYRGLDYIAGIAKTQCENARICAVLSGDLHHYSRYSADQAKTQFIIAGGGGAFLHPTHHLNNMITASWVGTKQVLHLNTEPGGDHELTNDEACYPDKITSRRLAWGNLAFPALNWDFCLVLGTLYWTASLVLLAFSDANAEHPAGFLSHANATLKSIIASPAFLVMSLVLVCVFQQYADLKKSVWKWIVGICHAMLHCATIVLAMSVVSALLMVLPQWLPELVRWSGSILPAGWWHFIGFGAGMIVSGFVGGLIWGLYLLVALFRYNIHYNDGFSSMRLDGYRHFLRMKIKGDTLTIFPIGLDRAPSRDDWEFNESYKTGDQNEPVIAPKTPFELRLIEGPVEIDANCVAPLRQVVSK